MIWKGLSVLQHNYLTLQCTAHRACFSLNLCSRNKNAEVTVWVFRTITWFWSIKKEEIIKWLQLISEVRTRLIYVLAMGGYYFELWWDKHSESCSSHFTHLCSSHSSASSFLAHSTHRVTGQDCADAAKVVLWFSGALVTWKLSRESALAHFFPDSPA